MSDFVQQNGTKMSFDSSDSWVILSPIEQSIKRKIEAVGTPLKDWDIQINYGIKTGFNDAFIITTETREQILSNCADEDERNRTEEIIRPILRGRDIKRYGYDWGDLWLIATFPSRKYDIENFPSLKKYLLSFAKEILIDNGYSWVADNYLAEYCHKRLQQTGEKIYIEGKLISFSKNESSRKKTNNKWFETQDSISYWEEFSKPKVFYPDITQNLDFAFCKDVFFCNNTTYFLSSNNPQTLKHVLHFINHKLYDWYYRTISVQLGATAVRMFSIYVLNLPVPTKFVENVYEAFGLTKEEEAFIDNL